MLYYAYGTNKHNLQGQIDVLKQIVVTRKKATIGAIVALALLVMGGAVMMYIMHDLRSQTDSPVEPVPVERVSASLDDYAKSGKVDEGIEYIDTQIEAQKSQEAKRELLVQKSQFATKVGRKDVALESAKNADAIKSDTSSSLALAVAYEERGDKKQAVKYYQQAVDGIEPETAMARYAHIWVEKIEELSQ